MQTDFHFYCIGVLARAAGFNRADASTIAYASQYVDNSTESEPIRLEIEGGDLSFEPVRTAYNPLIPSQGLESLSWSAQKRVFIPFHFIPSEPFDPAEPRAFSYVTEPGSPFAELLLDEAAREENRRRRLCRIGTALHTYADTWAHKDFSGRDNESENDVENIEVPDGDEDGWKHLLLENIVDDLPIDLIPEIGHAEALYFPDLPYQEWKCVIGSPKKPGGGNNVKDFLQAAEHIYKRLRRLREMDKDEPVDPIPWNDKSVDFVPWEELEPLVLERLADGPTTEPELLERFLPKKYLERDLQERCKRWRNQFIHWFEPHPELFSYDPKAWREEAFEGDTDWDDWTGEKWARESPLKLKPNFWDSLWVHFHRAALRHRHFVLENLP